MPTETRDDPFEPVHQVYRFKESAIQFEELPRFKNVSYFIEASCHKRLVGRYTSIMHQLNNINEISNLQVVVYPGTMCEINGHKRIFSVSGRRVFAPGKICKTYKEKGFIEVVAAVNFLECLMSVDSIERNGIGVSDRDVIDMAQKILGESLAEEFKIYYEISL